MNNANQHIPAGYKPSPLGIIPEDWEVKRLGEIFTFKNGVNAGKDSYGEGVRFVNTMDVLNNAYLIGNSLRGRVAINEKTKIEFLVSFGDVLFNRTSETREEVGCSTVYLDNEEAVFGGFVIRAHDKDANILNPIFKQYCFQPSYVRNQISALGNGAIRYNLGQEDLSKVNLLIPTKAEQESIVSLISLWDTAISKQTQLVEKLTLRKRGLMQQLLTGKKRLKGFEGEWKEVKLGEICDINKGEQVNTDTLTETGLFPVINGGIMPSGYKEEYNTEANTITISEGGNSCGFVNLIKTKFWSGGHCYTLSNIVNFDLNYLYYSLKFAEPHIMNLRVGSGLPNIQLGPLQKFILLMPQLEEQKANSAILIESDNEIEIQKQKLTSLQEQKKGLMQILLTGKKRIII